MRRATGNNALLIPVEWNRPEYFGRFFAAMGCTDDPAMRIVATPVGEAVLLHRVPAAEDDPAPHPLLLNLSRPREKGAVLRFQIAAGAAHYTLHHDGVLLFADTFPAADPVSVQFAVDRIIAAHRLDNVRIVELTPVR